MPDPREFSFGDWFSIFLRVIPAFLMATLVILLPLTLVGALVWLLIPIR